MGGIGLIRRIASLNAKRNIGRIRPIRPISLIWSLAVVHLTITSATQAQQQLDGTARSQNVIVIVVDDQGWADMSAYDHSPSDVRTPQIDRLARSGVLFTQAYSAAPICSAARAGWMTGRNPARWEAKASFNCGLPGPQTPTIAELLKQRGYTTARIGKSDYSNAGIHKQRGREYPLNHGYDEFLGFCAHGFDFFLLSQDIYDRTPDPRSHSASVGPLMHNRGTKEYKDGYLTEIFTDAAIDYVERHQEKPFFLTLSYNAVHHLVHQSPKRYLDKYGVKEIPNYDPDKDGKYGTWFKKHITLGKRLLTQKCASTISPISIAWTTISVVFSMPWIA